MSHYNPDPNKNVNLTIDGFPVTVPEGTTILEAARKINVNIPTLCNCSGLGKRAVCRLCVVECDGRGKLLPACSNDVWEGVKVVTNSLRLLGIRKTILELLLTEHPPECLSCVKNKKCELQDLAAAFGIREIPFSRRAERRRPMETESGVLVRDMGKCVKCGRCVEVCQEIQAVRAINSSSRSIDYEVCAPYGQSLASGTCVFCGQCAAVCPVGAIFGNDETMDVQAALDDSGLSVMALVMPPVIAGIERELGLSPGSISSGALVTVLKRMGFTKVFDSFFFAGLTILEEGREFRDRIGNGGKLPMISGCSPALKNFIQKFYPDLADHLPSGKSPVQIFRDSMRENYPEADGINKSKIMSVSMVPCISRKWETRQEKNGGSPRSDFSLTPQELARMIKTAGIDFTDLGESPFDSFPIDSQSLGSACAASIGMAENLPGKGVLQDKVYGAYTGKTPAQPFFEKTPDFQGIEEAEFELDGTRVKALSVKGLANARVVLDAVRKGECRAKYVEIVCCPMDSSCSGSGSHDQGGAANYTALSSNGSPKI